VADRIKTRRDSNEKSKANILLIIIALVTLFYSTSGFDPINTPKQIILFLSAAWLGGSLVLRNQKKLKVQILKIDLRLEVVLLIFVLFQFISAVVSEDKLTGIIGENNRKNGALTYLALVIVFVYTARFFSQINYEKFMLFIILLSFVLASYGILQFTGNDFQGWVNPYNPVILTVGNPNFASALLAILGVLLFSCLFVSQFKLFIRLFSGIVLTMVCAVIYKSDSIQGLVVLVLGSSLVLGCVLLVSPRTKRLSFVFFSALTGFSILAVMGMLQAGPLQSILYKESVSLRGHYWRAAWKMFTENPILGVGTDQYGHYFRYYREPSYSLNYGFEITSTNAHNIYLQFLSTGGIIVGMTYILFIALIFKSGVVYLFKSTNTKDEKIKFFGLYFAWVAYLIQGVVSIDNIALAIWGWFLGGAVYSLANRDKVIARTLKQENARLLYTSAFLLPTIILCAFMARAEADMLNQAKVTSLENTDQNRIYFKNLILKITSNPLSDQWYQRIAAQRLYDATEVDVASEILDSLILKYPSVPDNYYSRIIVNSKSDRLQLVIKDQEKLLELDPWNARNMLALGENYKRSGEYGKMVVVRDKILAFADATEIATIAREKLVLP
jgi:O-antigen ligase